MILTKNGNEINIETEVASNETQLILDIVLSFNASLNPREFIILNENPTNNELFGKITLSNKINNACLCFLNGNETKKYKLSDEKIINSTYTITQYSYTTFNQFSDSYLFYLNNSSIEDSLEISDNTHETIIKAYNTKFSKNNNQYVEIDVSGTNALMKVSSLSGDKYSRLSNSGFYGIDANSNECSISQEGLTVRTATNTTLIQSNGLIMVNNSYGNDGQFLVSKGVLNPAQWTTFTDSLSVNLAFSFGGLGNPHFVYTATILLNRIGNVVFGKMSLPSVSTQNLTGSTQVYIYGAVNTGSSTFVPSSSQIIGQIPLCYLSSSGNTFQLFGYGTLILGGSGNSINIKINFSPTGTETVSTGLQNNHYLATGADYVNSTLQYNSYFSFQYTLS